MEHKHKELIVRWASDTSLSILVKFFNKDEWVFNPSQDMPSWHNDSEYFLVAGKHVDVALHHMNGGDTQMFSRVYGKWVDNESGIIPNFSSVYNSYRIKPSVEMVDVWVGTKKGTSFPEFDVLDVDLDALPTSYREKYTWTRVSVEREV
jgi:hypothetical protein